MVDDEFFLIKERSDALKKSSVLSLLKEKEFQIKAEIVKTRQLAEDIVREAQQTAEHIVEKAAQKSRRDAEKTIVRQKSLAQNQAKKLLNEARKQLPQIKERMESRVESAVDVLVSIALGELSIEDWLTGGD